MRLFLTYGIVIFLAGWAKSQSLSSHVSKESILVGQETTLSYRITTKKGDSVSFEPLKGEIPSRILTGGNLQQDGTSFEIITDFHDTVIYNGSKEQWTGKYTITAWDSGLFVIPGPSVIINDSLFYFKDVAINCDLVAHDSKVDLYDIRENYADIPDEPFDLWKFLSHNWWWITILLIAGVFYFLVRRKKRLEEEEPERRISLKQRTLLAIEALEKEKLWEKDKLKEHFVELSYILRSYLTARYDISLLEKTTHQARIILKEKGLEEDTIGVINRILSQSDMVKFARSKPDTIEILKISALAKQIVAETSPLEIEDAE